MKLVEPGKLREDVVDAWVRRSRLPGLMTLELRSQIAGVELARERVLDMVAPLRRRRRSRARCAR